ARDRIDAESLVGGILHITVAAYQMKPGDQLLYADATDNVVVLTLPDMAEAMGKFYFIQAIDVSNDVSVMVKETATEIGTYGDMDATDDHALFFCTGRIWITVFDGVA
ncbi:hypothetical protein LCGC14_2479040, partial [marine sediment metagenome]